MSKINWFIVFRAITYAALFIGVVLIYVPAALLSPVGIVRPEAIRIYQIVGIILGVLGSAIALWCIITFAITGKGTPAPFDAPRKLVVRGPYRYVRNPMYIGAGFALIGAGSFYESLVLLGYAAFLFIASHLFVVWYEEPTLRRTFGPEYETYCRQVRRWWPKFKT
jgi:protein-S-isoprenylcysteine O-methyltransferase Ste14